MSKAKKAPQSKTKANQPPAPAPKAPAKKLPFFTKPILYSLIITILFVPVYQHIFDKKVALLGDNAAYFILGKALANGDGFVNANIIDKPKANHFPPGYPAFMAMVMKTFGDKITTLKTANGVLLWLSLLILFFFFRNISKNIDLSFIITLALVFNIHLLQYSTWMMSEIPFLFTSSLSLLLLSLYKPDKKPWMDVYFLLAIVIAAASYYVRGQGLAVFAGIFVFLLFGKKWIHAAGISCAFWLIAFTLANAQCRLTGKQLFESSKA